MRRLTYISLLSLLLGLTSAVAGCNGSGDKIRLLTADLDQAKVVTIDPENITWLETNDSSLLYDISNITHLNGRMLIQSRTLWKIFSNDGSFVGEVTHKGEGPDNFLWMGNIWNDDSLVYMYDFSLNKIQKYDSDGRYHGYDTITRGDAEDFDTNPIEAYITRNDGVFYVNRFMGNEPFNYVFCHASDIHSVPEPIRSRRHENGHTFYNRIFIDNDNHRLLYWEHIKDTLFTVTTDGVEPLYVFDYGENKVPKEVTDKRQVVDRFLALQDMGENDYAYPMRYFQMHDGKIYFFVAKHKQGYIGCIDEKKDGLAFTEFRTPEGMHLLPQLFFNIHGDDILLSVINEDKPEENPGLLRFPISELNKP